MPDAARIAGLFSEPHARSRLAVADRLSPGRSRSDSAAVAQCPPRLPVPPGSPRRPARRGSDAAVLHRPRPVESAASSTVLIIRRWENQLEYRAMAAERVVHAAAVLLHDVVDNRQPQAGSAASGSGLGLDRKSTRLNSS